MKERIRVRLGAETVLVFGPESVSYERSRPIDRCILREISARAPFLEKSKKIKKNQISNISRIWENWKNPISNISRIIQNVEDFNFQYLQDMRTYKKSDFQYFQDMRNWGKIRFPVFPGYERIVKIRFPNISRIRNN